jgi:hypothetical protein
LEKAVEELAVQAQEDWVTAILHAPLWQGERDAYAASVVVEKIGPLSARISSDYQYAAEIETGRPAYDLKAMLRTSHKTRMGKKGLYLIIPFRHMVKGMTPTVRKAAKALSPSMITGTGTRVSASGHTVAQHKYLWGERLKAGSVKGMLRRQVGMVRFDVSTPGVPYSNYITFRTMSGSSSGWIIAPRAGLNLLQKVADTLRPVAEAKFAAAVKVATLNSNRTEPLTPVKAE